MKRERFNPVELNIDETRERWSRDPEFVKAYDALADEFAALDKEIRTRRNDDAAKADRPGESKRRGRE